MRRSDQKRREPPKHRESIGKGKLAGELGPKPIRGVILLLVSSLLKALISGFPA
jgi:hypothetical protein